MKYEVAVTRISYATVSFLIDAESEEEAKDKALDEAYNTAFDEDTAEYEIDSCDEADDEDEETQDDWYVYSMSKRCFPSKEE